MNAKQLQKQLQREFKANPTKAAALGLLLVVAVVFWARLALGWLPDSSPSAGTLEVTPAWAVGLPAPAAADPNGKTRPVDEVSLTEPTWNQVVEWMNRDQLMQPALSPPGLRDPFLAHHSRLAQNERDQQQDKPRKTVLTPEVVGLRLTSTIVGSRRRVATIGGRAYREGRRIVRKLGPQTVVFQLAEVHPKHVVLVRENHRFELKIAAVGPATTSIVETEKP